MTNQTQFQLHNLDAEKTVIGSLLIDPEATPRISSELKVEHFYDPVYREIYETISKMHNSREPVDFITVANTLESNHRVAAIGGSAFLADVASNVPTASHVDMYAKIVRELALRREYRKATVAIAKAAAEREVSITDLRAMCEERLLGIQLANSGSRPKLIADHASDWHERYCDVHGLSQEELSKRMLTTGFRCLDKFLHLAPGNVMILAGRTSMGKTALAIDIAMNVCRQNRTVAFFSYEMTTHEVMDRILAGRLGVPTRTLQQGQLTDELYDRLGPIMDDIRTYPLFLENNSDRSLDTFVSRARRLKLEHNLNLLVVDYLQLLITTAKFAQQSRVQMVSHVSNTLKSLAMELECPIIALAQLSRKTEDRPNKRPQLADLRESGEIEQDADQVLMLYREGYYNEDCENPNLTDVFIRKNRQGETGQVQLHFDATHMTFRELDYRH